MEKTRYKIEAWQMVFVGVASAFAVVFLNSMAYGFTPQTLVDSIIHTFFISSSVCIGILYVAPKIYDLSASKRVLIVAIAIFLATIAGIYLTKFFLALFDNYGIANYATPGRRTVLFALLISYIFGFGAYFYLHSQKILYRTTELLRQKELDEALAKTTAAEAQLASLESRIHPHFLFNTLNSIAALINENPEKAENMVEKLSALLRYSLDSNSGGLVSLVHELEITEKYLEIEKVRFEDRIEYTIETPQDMDAIKVPALSLQTLVENSIKHAGSQSSKKTIISILVVQDERHAKIEVSDNGGGFSTKDLINGHGLDNLKERLNSVFQNRANLEIAGNGGGGKVRLIVPKQTV